MTPNAKTNEPLFSEFANDSDMMQLVELFVEEMGDRISTLERCWSDGALNDLQTISHQLRGASGGYGFPSITDAAAVLEKHLNEDDCGLAQLSDSFEHLVLLCKRASA